MGLAPELLPRVFELFVQSDRTLDRAQGGLGIGLSVAKRLIEIQEGSNSASSGGVGCGATFEIRIPLIEKGDESAFEVCEVKVRSRRIMVVDDNADAANSLAMLLELESHEVEPVYTSQQALTRAQLTKPDVVLLDIGLPEIDGYEVARRRLRPALSGTSRKTINELQSMARLEPSSRRCRSATMAAGRVLVSGAGIAGPALVYWLQRFGFEVTLVERAATLRPGGQAIDVRGVAVEVLKRMDLYAPAYDRRTHMRGSSALDADGNEIWRSEGRSFSGGRLDSGDVELFRDDLVRLLYEATKGKAEYLWNDSITSVEQATDTVRVAFGRGPPRDFDLLVGADGLHSNTRSLVFGSREAASLQAFGIGLASLASRRAGRLRHISQPR